MIIDNSFSKRFPLEKDNLKRINNLNNINNMIRRRIMNLRRIINNQVRNNLIKC